MYSWVRYSVAIYLGLALAGATGGPPIASDGSLEGTGRGACIQPASGGWHASPSGAGVLQPATVNRPAEAKRGRYPAQQPSHRREAAGR
jgi:hypothetical protein